MHVGIEARLVDGQWGGVQQFIMGLASGLSQITNPGTRFTFFMYANHTAWLEPYMSGNCDIFPLESYDLPESAWKNMLKARFPVVRNLLHLSYHYLKPPGIIEPLDDAIVQTGIDMIHFPHQVGRMTTLPSLYHPWDLQHRHLPTLFTRYERNQRDHVYRTLCTQAAIVNVASDWIKADLSAQYDIPASKIRATAPGSVLSLYPEVSETDMQRVRDDLRLPARFIFYPSKLWPHKNHLRLIDALKKLSDEHDLVIPLVLSGSSHTHEYRVRQRVKYYHMTNQVTHVGYVSPMQLQCLYRLAEALVFPSKFEGWGLPVTEAMSVGLPIVCSNIPTLVDQVGDAALLVDPNDTNALAKHLKDLWLDDELRQSLREKAFKRSRLFDWGVTAAQFVEQYQQIITATA